MRALTLVQPMAWAIVRGTKRIENRPRNLPKAMRGVSTVVAVHGGRGWSDEYADVVSEIMRTNRVGCEHGIVGLMRLTGRVWTHQDMHDYNTNSPQRDNNDYDLVREYSIRRRKYDHRYGVKVSPWYSGPFGYEISDAVAFDQPIPCRGMLGFWTVPDDVLLAARVCSACGWHHPPGKAITGCVMR